MLSVFFFCFFCCACLLPLAFLNHLTQSVLSWEHRLLVEGSRSPRHRGGPPVGSTEGPVRWISHEPPPARRCQRHIETMWCLIHQLQEIYWANLKHLRTEQMLIWTNYVYYYSEYFRMIALSITAILWSLKTHTTSVKNNNNVVFYELE